LEVGSLSWLGRRSAVNTVGVLAANIELNPDANAF